MTTKALEKLREELAASEEMVYEYEWVPRTSSGKQKTPKQIRSAVIKYCAKEGMSLNQFRQKHANVNGNTWSKFMNMRYKNQ